MLPTLVARIAIRRPSLVSCPASTSVSSVRRVLSPSLLPSPPRQRTRSFASTIEGMSLPSPSIPELESSPLPPPPTPPSAVESPAASASRSTWAYRYVQTPEALAEVLEAIRALPEPDIDAVIKRRHIFFDSEGYELGTSVGKLSIIQLGLPIGPSAEVDVFLVDVLALSAPDISASVLRGMWDVLEDDRFIKVGWDLKGDWAELFHSHSVDMTGVLDLQVAELLGRVRASEALRDAGREGMMEHRPGWVWSLGGMKRAVDDFQALGTVEREDAEKLFHSVRARFEAGGSAAWLDRPLTDDLLQYAALDIRKLAALFPLFHTDRPPPTAPLLGRKPPPPADDPLISSTTLSDIFTVSDRALGVHRPQRRSPDDEHHQHAYLPSEVLTSGTGDVRPEPCPGCNRMLHESSWQMPQSRFCMTCWAVQRRLQKKRGGWP